VLLITNGHLVYVLFSFDRFLWIETFPVLWSCGLTNFTLSSASASLVSHSLPSMTIRHCHAFPCTPNILSAWLNTITHESYVLLPSMQWFEHIKEDACNHRKCLPAETFKPSTSKHEQFDCCFFRATDPPFSCLYRGGLSETREHANVSTFSHVA